jgi:TM2 domain-containing membrane protein YozV
MSDNDEKGIQKEEKDLGEHEGRTAVVWRKGKYCFACGSNIHFKAEICPKCGVRQQLPKPVKEPGLAAVLSFLFIGLGQIYNGQLAKGFAFMAGLFISFLLGFGGILLLLPGLWLWSILDAYDSAREINQKQQYC